MLPPARITRLIAIAVALAAVAAFSAACITAPAPAQQTATGVTDTIHRSAPGIVATTMAGETFNLSTTRGAPTLIVFWAPWCPHCQREMPELQNAYRSHLRQDGHQIVGIAIMTTGQQARQFTDEHQLTFPNVYDRQNAIASQYGVTVVPTYVFLNRAGDIALRTDITENAGIFSQIFDILAAGPD